MRVKPGAQLDGLHYMLWYAAAVWDYLRLAYGLGEGTVTSGLDGADGVGAARVRGSLHPRGMAIDFRTRDLPPGVAPELAASLRGQLGPFFDVVEEQDHIHVELSPQALSGS